MKTNKSNSAPVKSVVFGTLCLLCGCGTVDPTPVKIVHIEYPADDDAHFFVLQEPYTVIETLDTGQRHIVPGIFGKPGDEFSLAPMTAEIPSR